MFTSLQTWNDNHTGCSLEAQFLKFETESRADQRWTEILKPHLKERMEKQRKKIVSELQGSYWDSPPIVYIPGVHLGW